MPNMRIINKNLSSLSFLSADEEDLSIDNLSDDIKTNPWRSTTTNPTITVEFQNPQLLSAFVLAFSNLTATATFTVSGFTLFDDVVPVFNTGAVLCCPSGPISSHMFGIEYEGIDSVSIGGGAYAVSWFSETSVERLEVEINDVNNTMGYIEAGGLIVGKYWEAKVNADYGAKISYEDRSVVSRTEAGDSIVDRGTTSKSVTISLSFMDDDDRRDINQIMVDNGVRFSLFASLFPEDANSKLEQTYQLYGKISSTMAIVNKFYSINSSSLTIEEV